MVTLAPTVMSGAGQRERKVRHTRRAAPTTTVTERLTTGALALAQYKG